MTGRRPTLGIIRLDYEEATEESSTELTTRGAVTPFRIDSPAFWPVPFIAAIAKGADPAGNKVPTREARDGILDAAIRLDGRADLIIGDCGYMWASREHVYGKTETPTLTSGLELLDLALRITSAPVGIVTWDPEPLTPLLRDHPGWQRLRLLGLADLSEWRKTVSIVGYEKPDGWTMESLAKQFTERLTEAFADGGVFDGVGVIVAECTMVPDFRAAIRSVTTVPVLDLAHFAKAALE